MSTDRGPAPTVLPATADERTAAVWQMCRTGRAREVRLRAGLRQEDMAELALCSQTAVSAYERSARRPIGRAGRGYCDLLLSLREQLRTALLCGGLSVVATSCAALALARTWTRADVEALGLTTDVPTAGSVLGVSRGSAYELARRGELPVRVLRLGARLRVPVRDLLDLLDGAGPAA